MDQSRSPIMLFLFTNFQKNYSLLPYRFVKSISSCRYLSIILFTLLLLLYRMTQKKRELLKNPTKIEEIQEKKLLTEIEPLQLAF